MEITLIASMNRPQVIGADGDIPWHLPEDLKHFADTVKDRIIICGRKTFDTLPRKYHNKFTIVITSWPNIPNCTLASSMFDAIRKAKQLAVDENKSSEFFVVGGGQVYQDAIGMADKLILTYVFNDLMGDTFFPEIPYSRYSVYNTKTFNWGKIIWWKKRAGM